MDSSMKEVNLYPKVCNLCGGKVECISNSVIYGREYGSGYCYRCQSCGAYVGTHKPWPKRAMGILETGCDILFREVMLQKKQ